MNTNITNRVAEIRKSRGISASDLARRVNVSRQTIYAIEAGTYVPNTEVSLQLARELEVSVDDLLDSPFTQIGTVDQIVESLEESRETYGFSNLVLFDGDFEAYAPVVARLAGR